ncbi:MAG: CHAT domain-containing protein [Anaerolineae bacterium]|nr:CHAT domain-containing protein [Anaerolineae bacterium]
MERALWPIYDQPAAEFAVQFYNKVLEGYMIGEVMRQARCQIRKAHPDQITWAAFVLYGDPTFRLIA